MTPEINNNINNNNSAKILGQLRESIARTVMNAITELMVKISCKDSGMLAETVLQMLSDDVFDTVFSLISNNDELSGSFVFEFANRIADKLGKSFDTVEPMLIAAGHLAVLIHYESMRRKGLTEYSLQLNIFSPGNSGLTKLTQKGKEMYYSLVLENLPTQKYKT